MKNNSKYYSKELEEKVGEYFKAVKSDVGIENIGVLFFEGDSYAFREKLHNLYLEQDVGYVLLIGNDLMEELHDLNYTNYENSLAITPYTLAFGESECPTLVVSTLPTPPNSDLDQQKQFIINQMENYIRFHKDPETYLTNFSRSYIRIANLDVSDDYTSFDESSPDIEDIRYCFDLPKRDILSYDPELQSEIRKEKPMILEIMAHGWTRVLAWQVTHSSACNPEHASQLPSCTGNTDDWLNYTKDFIPSVLILNTGCGGSVADDYNTSKHGSYLADFCCWPQAFLKGGSLAYISESHSRAYDLTGSDFFGQAVGKTPYGALYAGDLFAHI